MLFSCTNKKKDDPKQEADTGKYELKQTLYYGGDILTMDGDQPEYVEAVVEREGQIVFVGSKEDALKQYKRKAKQVDLKGKTMLPGFIDPHGHFMSAIQMVNQVNVAGSPVGTVTDIPSVITLLKAYQAENHVPDGGWLVGWGYDNEQINEKRHITKVDLDPHFPNHKVMLIHVSMHGAVLNSKALEWANIDADTETPSGGVIARIPGSQEPAGLLMETAYLPVFEKFPQPTEAEMLQLMKPAQMMYASEGYTHAQEGFTHLKDLDFLQKAAQEGKIFLDIIALPGFTEMDEWLNKPQYTFGTYKNGLKLQGMKITQDGSPQGKTAHVSHPYLTGGPGGEKNWTGETTIPKDQFIALVKKAFENDLQVFIHSNGDATIDQAIEAVEAANVTAKDDKRTVIIHSQFQRPDQLPKYVELGLTPSYFTNHTFFWGEVHIKNIGQDAAAFISPVKAATKLGLKYSNHTDFNVTPLNPFFVMWTAMAREMRNGEVLGADQRVDAYTALQGLTTGPAYQIFEEQRKGKIKKGMLADFVILGKNPLKATNLNAIKDIEVVETIKEGATIFKK